MSDSPQAYIGARSLGDATSGDFALWGYERIPRSVHT